MKWIMFIMSAMLRFSFARNPLFTIRDPYAPKTAI